MAIRPQQRISTAKKLKDKTWQRDTLLYWREACANPAIDPQKALTLYRAANGEMNEADYTYITNPLNTNRPELQGYPAKIRNVPIIPPVILFLMGEKGDRPFDCTVVVRNSDLPSKISKKEQELVLQALQQEFINELIAQGSYNGKSEPPKSPDQIKREANSLGDEKAIMAQDWIDYCNDYCDIPRKFRKGFYDWLVTSRVFSFKEVVREDIEYSMVSPIELSYIKNRDIDFIEDAEAVKRTVYMSINEVIDKFQDFEDFDDEIRAALESKVSNIGTLSYGFSINDYFAIELQRNLFGSIGEDPTNRNNSSIVPVEHMVFLTNVKVGRLTIINPETGEPEEITVDEDYISQEGEEVRWTWVNEYWEGYIVDNVHHIGVRPLPLTRASINNPGKSKNPYNGRVFSSRYVDPISLCESGMPYQIKHNIIHYFLEKIMNKNKDKIVVMPLGLIPEKEGHDMFTTMYYADANGFLFVDDSNPQAMQSMNAVKPIDLSLSKYIGEIYRMLKDNKQEWYDSIGFNNQRMGEVAASAGKATTEEATYRSSLASEEWFLQYDEFQEKEYQGIADLGKYCCLHGKKASYISSDYKRKYLNIYPHSFSDIECGVFAKSSIEERRKMKILKAQAQNFIQNAMPGSYVAKILDANNLSKLVEDLKEAERILDENKQKVEQKQLDHEEHIAQRESDDKQKDLDFKYYKVDQDNETSRQNNLNSIDAQLLQLDKKLSGEQDIGVIEKLSNERVKLAEEAAIEREKIRADREKALIRERAEKYKADMTYKTAKETAKNKKNA